MASQEFRGIVRIVDKDVKGEKRLLWGLGSVKGVSHAYANAICNVLNYDPYLQVGNLSEEDVARIEDVAKNPLKYNIPVWMLNRRKDPESKEDGHFVSNDLIFKTKLDIRKVIKLKTYKGIRHASGLPVRGQNTKSTHRRGGGVVGVVKKRLQPGAAPAGKEGGRGGRGGGRK